MKEYFKDRKIVQIIPAVGAFAYFKEGENNQKIQIPVVCWALIEWHDMGITYQRITGMIIESFNSTELVDASLEDDFLFFNTDTN